MTERDQETAQERPTTSPPDPTHEATTPPGNPAVDQDAVDKGQDNLDRAGGGH
jgi:hypothetical protein